GLLLSGCSGEEEAKETENTGQNTEGQTVPVQEDQVTEGSEQQVDEQEGTSAPVAQPIEEAESIPPEEKEALLQALDRHIDAFNAKDLDAYMDTISKNPVSFDYEEEREYMKKMFETFDMKLEPQHVVIIKYDDEKKEANIFTAMKTQAKEVNADKTVEHITRQVSVYRKEEGGWKQISTFAMQ
ncbi:MAG TPA: hypothetical protein VEY51_18145, partial [Chondromyces sp.]|nr:hypothetical protein [Chondromyces sp.]